MGNNHCECMTELSLGPPSKSVCSQIIFLNSSQSQILVIKRMTDLVTFTEEILNGKLHFFYSVGTLDVVTE